MKLILCCVRSVRVLLFSVFCVSAFLIVSPVSAQDVASRHKENTIPPEVQIDFWSDYTNELLARSLVDRMTDEELYAQILMFGWAGAEPEKLLYQWVGGRGLGSVKVFGWNTDDINLVAKSIYEIGRAHV